MSIIKPNEHVGIFGKTGSGKTWAARKYLSAYPYVVVLDPKRKFVWPEVPQNTVTLASSLNDLKGINTPRIIYRPPHDEMNNDDYNRFFDWIYQRQNCIVYIDEVYLVCPNPHTMPEMYGACIVEGRELNIGVWSGSQRPVNIPSFIISEATHLYCFDLNLKKDRERIADVSGYDEFKERPGYRNFWYINLSDPAATGPTRATLKEV